MVGVGGISVVVVAGVVLAGSVCPAVEEDASSRFGFGLALI